MLLKTEAWHTMRCRSRSFLPRLAAVPTRGELPLDGLPAVRTLPRPDRRRVHTRRAIAATGKLGTANRPRYLFSGLTKCGVCGAGFIIGSANRLMCSGARDQGTCSNRLTIRRDEVEQRVLDALQEKLLRHDLFEEFCEEFTREMNRLRMEYRANLSSAERELERVRAGIRKVIDATASPGRNSRPRWTVPYLSWP